MPNKKIIIVATSTLLGDQRLQRIALSLHNANFPVLLVGRCFSNTKATLSFPYTTHRILCHYEKGILAYLEFNLRLLLFLLSQKTQILCSVDADTIIPAYLAARIKNWILAFDAHEWFSQVPELIHRKQKQSLWQNIENAFIPKVDVAYTVSSTLATIFSSQYHIPFALVRNMPNTNSTKSTITKTQPFAIYAGAVNEGRGLELLAEIAPQSPIPITICGDGDLYSKFSNSSIPQLTFTGFLPPAILQEKIQQAYLGILILNPNSPSYYYSLANKFFDYIQAGIPVIFPPLPEYLSLNAEIEVGIPCEYNAAAILAAIHLLTTDTQLYQKLQANTQIAAKIWNWQNEEQVLLQLYKNL